MKLLPKIFVLSALMSALAFAEPCPEGEYCYSVDMKSVSGAYKETLCTETEHFKKCDVAVWVPVNEGSIFIDLNSFKVDEEDVFIKIKIAQGEIPYAVRYLYPTTTEFYLIDYVRFDCERGLYKTFSTEYRTKKQFIQHEELKEKPTPVKDIQWLEPIYNRACAAHKALTKD